MSNMAYCRFENTLHDLHDCHNALKNLMEKDFDEMSQIERNAMYNLIMLCKKISDIYGDIK